MKKVINFFKKRSWLLVVLACLIFIPQSFSYQAKLNMRVVVTGLALDSAQEGYEVTAQVVMPKPGSESGGTSAKLDFISEKGASIAEGIQKIAYKIGKVAGLSHTDFIMIGENLLEKNIIPILDYFARKDQVSPALMLLVCKGKAKDMIQQTKNLELSVGVGLQKVFINKQNSLNGMVTAVDEFINNSYSLSKMAYISGIEIAPEGQEDSGGSSSGSGNSSNSDLAGGSQSGSSQNDSQSSNGQSNSSARIKFYNDIYYFKNGMYAGKLDSEEEVLGMFFACMKCATGDFKVEGISGDTLEDAVVGVHFSCRKNGKSVEFKDGKPVLKFTVGIGHVRVDEVLNNGKPSIALYNKENDEMTRAIKDGIKAKIEKCIRATFEKAKADDVDIFGLGPLAYQTKTSAFKDFYRTYGDSYLKNSEIEVDVSILTYN